MKAAPRTMLVAGLAAALSIGAATTSHAALVRVLEPPAPAVPSIVFADLGPHDNALEVTQEGAHLVFEDAAAVQAGSSCVQDGPNRARCPRGGIGTIYIHVGGGTNEVDVATWYRTEINGADATSNDFHGGYGVNVITGGAGNDVLTGGSVADTIAGGAGRDVIAGGYGGDALDGQEGDDAIDGGLGLDSIAGGPGVDVADYSSRTGSVAVSLGSTTLIGNDGEAGEGDHVKGDVENVKTGWGDDTILAGAGSAAHDFRGGPGADRLVGGAGPDVLEGEEGPDRLDGGGGDDMVTGLGGDDVLAGGPARDVLSGGVGADTVSYAGVSVPVFVDLDDVPEDDGAQGEGDTIIDAERIIGGDAGDTLTGSSGRDVIHGGDGADAIDGGEAADQLFGDGGDDHLRSVDGAADTSDCGAGTDTALADAIDLRTACELPAPVVQPPPNQPQPNQPQPGAGLGPAMGIALAAKRATRSGHARLRLGCPASASTRCAGTLRLARGVKGKPVRCGSRSFSLPAGSSATLRVRLAKGCRRALRRSGRITFSVAATAADALSAARVSTQQMRIRRARPS